MKATEELRAEHDGILIMLEILERISNKMAAGEIVDLGHLDQILEFLRVFADRCHHGKEEGILFPAMEEAGVPKEGGPIGVMLYEHTDGRGHIKEMSDALESMRRGIESTRPAFLDASRRYIELLRQHIEKENHVLFPMADASLSPESQSDIAERFEEFEKDKIGEGRHEAFHEMMNELSRIYLSVHAEVL